jgi:hypothetical protein
VVFVWPNPNAFLDAGADGDVPTGPSCGQDDGQVCASAASLPPIQDAGVATGPWAGIYDCFADAIFANLPTNEAGSYTYSASIFGFNKATYDKLVGDADPSLAVCARPDQSTNFADCLALVTSTAATSATWATTCPGAEVPGVPALGACCPLASCNAPSDGDGGGEDGGATQDSAASDAAVEDATLDETSDDGPGVEGAADALAEDSPIADAADATLDGGPLADATIEADVDGAADASMDANVDASVNVDANVDATTDAPTE